MGDGANEVAPSSLENKSKKLKKRVHYHKFTRGKDLSRYSSKDLDCILGSDAVKKKRKEDEEAANSKLSSAQQSGDEEEISVGEVVKSHGLVTINSGSINDYFAKKMADLKKAKSGEVDGEGEDAAKAVKKKSKKNAKGSETEVPAVKLENDEESSHDTTGKKKKSKKKMKKIKDSKEDSSNTTNACENVERVEEKESDPSETENADLKFGNISN